MVSLPHASKNLEIKFLEPKKSRYFINIYITKNATPSRTGFNTIKELTAEETTVVSKQTTALRLRRWNWNGVGTAARYSNNLFQ